MKQLKQISFLLSIIILLSSCGINTAETIDAVEHNEELVKRIDALAFTECTIRLELDPDTKQRDTISRVKIKRDEKGNKVFEEIINTQGDQHYLSKTYYWEEEDVFLETRKSNSGYEYHSEVFKDKNGLIKRLIIYSGFGEEKDTLVLNYDYEFTPSNKKSKLFLTTVHEKETVKSTIEYNEEEKIKKETTVVGKDTLEIKTYSYHNSKLKEIIKKKFSTDIIITKIVNKYDRNGNLVEESLNETKSDSTVIAVMTSHEYNDQNEWIAYFELDQLNGNFKRVEIKKESCDD